LGTLVFIVLDGLWVELKIGRPTSWAEFTSSDVSRDRIVVNIGLRKGRLELLASISRVSMAEVRNTTLLLSRAWVVVGGGIMQCVVLDIYRLFI
jgi:hypothetical protein